MSSSSIFKNTVAWDIVDKLLKSLIISGFLIYLLYISSFNFNNSSSWLNLINHLNPTTTPLLPPLNPSHIVFGIAATATTWHSRKHYVEAWWRPNATRGHVFLDKIHPDLLPWPNHTLPPFRLSSDTSKYKDFDHHKARQAIRMARIVVEAVEADGGGAWWYVMTDDDTVVFVDNLVAVLSRYDHGGYVYVGMNSETHASNVQHSFEMAFGGAGYALSRPLAKALAANLDVCLKRYPTLYGSDHIVQSCVADLGVSITKHVGFHQVDLHNDITGYLAAHAQAAVVTLHHLDQVDPIFPSMSRNDSLKHLMKSAGADQSRLLQQSVCYHKPLNWTVSLSWGYSVHIYESIIPPSVLHRPIQTFTPWTTWARPFFLLNTRFPSNHPCYAPHEFFFHSLPNRTSPHSYVITSYSRGRPRTADACLNHSAHSVSTILLLSPPTKFHVIGNRRECCDVSMQAGNNNATAEIKLRQCFEDEIIP